MSKIQKMVLVILIITMVLVAVTLGNWSEQINPDGIAPHPIAQGDIAEAQSAPRDAFSFGVSMGLLTMALAYFCLAFGLVISARSKGKSLNRFTIWVAGLAGLGLALSYLIDDFFY